MTKGPEHPLKQNQCYRFVLDRFNNNAENESLLAHVIHICMCSVSISIHIDSIGNAIAWKSTALLSQFKWYVVLRKVFFSEGQTVSSDKRIVGKNIIFSYFLVWRKNGGKKHNNSKFYPYSTDVFHNLKRNEKQLLFVPPFSIWFLCNVFGWNCRCCCTCLTLVIRRNTCDTWIVVLDAYKCGMELERKK